MPVCKTKICPDCNTEMVVTESHEYCQVRELKAKLEKAMEILHGCETIIPSWLHDYNKEETKVYAKLKRFLFENPKLFQTLKGE